MRLLGFDISRAKTDKALSSVSENRGGWYRILESFAGAWQSNVTVDHNTVLSYFAVNACMTLIASDIAKLRVKLVQQDGDGIWTETANPAYSPVLRRPNGFQNRIQFWEYWMLSKLSRGNVYALKQRDARGVVVRLYILDPQRVTPLVSDGGDVFYRLQSDNMSGLEQSITVPAREIIHDRMNCLFHPLVGTSPIFAAGVAATQGLRIQGNSAQFFGNKSQPGGILTAPGAMSDATAARLKEYWESNFTGEKAGRVAVVGDGLEYKPLGVTAHDSQLIEQLKWTAEVVCSVFHVPTYKIGIGTMPTYNNVQALNVEYYSQCLQVHIEAAELSLDEGLDMASGIGTEFDIDGLLRMDSVTQMDVLDKAKNVMKPNEARKKLDLPPVVGGDTVYRQQQDYSLAALSKRDSLEDPFAAGKASPPSPAAPIAADEEDDEEEAGEMAAAFLVTDLKRLGPIVPRRPSIPLLPAPGPN